MIQLDFKERHELVKQMFTDGKSADEITEATGYKWNTIKIILNKGGISYATKVKYDYAGVKEMRSSGMSANEISEKTNIPADSVRAYLSRNRLSVSKSLAPPIDKEPIVDIRKLQHARPRREYKVVIGGRRYTDLTEKLFEQPDVDNEVFTCMTN